MAELFKFRCYQCQKLIGAPASKLGKVVNCPRCGAELVIPSPAAEGETPDEPLPDPDAFRPEALGLELHPERIGHPDAPSARPVDPNVPNPVAFLERASVIADDPAIQDEPDPDPNEPIDESAFPEPRAEPLVPRKPGQRRSRTNEPTYRARDVVLPRTAAVAWAMFGLMALAFAFTSGLVIGHFLWR